MNSNLQHSRMYQTSKKETRLKINNLYILKPNHFDEKWKQRTKQTKLSKVIENSRSVLLSRHLWWRCLGLPHGAQRLFPEVLLQVVQTVVHLALRLLNRVNIPIKHRVNHKGNQHTFYSHYFTENTAFAFTFLESFESSSSGLGFSWLSSVTVTELFSFLCFLCFLCFLSFLCFFSFFFFFFFPLPSPSEICNKKKHLA